MAAIAPCMFWSREWSPATRMVDPYKIWWIFKRPATPRNGSHRLGSNWEIDALRVFISVLRLLRHIAAQLKILSWTWWIDWDHNNWHKLHRWQACLFDVHLLGKYLRYKALCRTVNWDPEKHWNLNDLGEIWCISDMFRPSNHISHITNYWESIPTVPTHLAAQCLSSVCVCGFCDGSLRLVQVHRCNSPWRV